MENKKSYKGWIIGIIVLFIIIGIIGANNEKKEMPINNNVPSSNIAKNNENEDNQVEITIEEEKITINEKIEVIEKMIEENKNGFLACKNIVLNYKTKRQSDKQWQEFADSWEININQAKYLVEKCDVANLTGTDFLPGLLKNLKDGNIIN